MESTQSIYIESINQTWELPDDLVIQLEEYKKEHSEDTGDPDAFHLAWFQSLNEQDQAKVNKHTPQP